MCAMVGVGCGDDGGQGTSDKKEPAIVSAAASLTEALTACRNDVSGVQPRLSFADSDDLAELPRTIAQ